MDLRSLRRPFHLICDFDGTLTKKDTMSLVGQVAYQQHARSNRKDPPTLPPWSRLVNAYMDDYTAHQSAYSPKTEDRQAILQEREWLYSLAPIENKSVRRVESSGLFKGVTSKDVAMTVREAIESGELQLRNGWFDLFRRAKDGPGPQSGFKSEDPTVEIGNLTYASKVSILSVNWSEHFIRCTLSENIARQQPNPHAEHSDYWTSFAQNMYILANEISGLHTPEGGDGSLTKKDSTGIRTSSDKLRQLPERCRRPFGATEMEPSETEIDDGGRDVVYIGDSTTDLECLLAADFGFCIRDEPMGSGQRELAETLQRLGVKVLHVSQQLGGRSEHSERWVVYWARDLQEIADVLPGV